MIISEVLTKMLPKIRISTSPKNYNTEVGLVLAILEIESYSTWTMTVFTTMCRIVRKWLFGPKTYDVLVLEYGIDHPGDMEYLLSITQPHMSIFTWLDKVHAAYFDSIDDILVEKMYLMQHTKEITFIPVQASYTKQYVDDLSIDILSYALHDTEKADIGFSEHRLQMQDDEVAAVFTIQQEGDQLMQIQTNTLGQEQAGYVSLWVEIAMVLERRLETPRLAELGTPLPPGDNLSSLQLDSPRIRGDHQWVYELIFQQQPGRFTLFEGQFGSTLIDSSYNAAPKSMMKVIENTIRLRKEIYHDKDLIYCLGDMRELGDFAEEEHRALASTIAHSADAVYLIGEWMTSALHDELIKIGYNAQNIFNFTDSTDLGNQLLKDIEPRERCSVILFKGSQNTIFLEEAVKQVLRDTNDAHLLCRQSSWWMEKKKNQEHRT